MKKFIIIDKQKRHNITLDKKGKYLIFFYNYSGDITISILKPLIHVDIFGIFIGRDRDLYQIRTTQKHTVGKSSSNLLIRSVLYDAAKLHYSGTIRLEKNAQKTHAYQKNENILLSNHSHIESRPDLEILADDVYCTHGSTTGQLAADQLLYLQNRGINKKYAKKLLIRGFISDIFDRISKLGYDKEISQYKSNILKLFP